MRVIIDVSRALAEAGFSTEFVVPEYACEPPFALHPSSSVVVVPTPSKGARLYWLSWLAAHAAEDCDIVVATSYRSPWYIHGSLLRNRRRTTPIIYMMQHDEVLSQVDLVQGRPLFKALMRPLARGSYKLPAHQVAVSSWIAQRVGRLDTRIIANGVDSTVFYPATPTRPIEPPTPTRPLIVGAIARPGGAKGFEELIATCVNLRRSMGDSVRFLFASPHAGTLPLPPELVPCVQCSRPSTDEQMRGFYQSLDLFLFTSPCEGFGLPPLESMACGVPVVTTRCGGNAEYATETNCMLVDAGDVDALVGACVALAQQSPLRQRLRDEGLATAALFPLDGQCAQWVKLFQEISPGSAGVGP